MWTHVILHVDTRIICMCHAHVACMWTHAKMHVSTCNFYVCHAYVSANTKFYVCHAHVPVTYNACVHMIFYMCPHVKKHVSRACVTCKFNVWTHVTAACVHMISCICHRHVHRSYSACVHMCHYMCPHATLRVSRAHGTCVHM